MKTRALVLCAVMSAPIPLMAHDGWGWSTYRGHASFYSPAYSYYSGEAVYCEPGYASILEVDVQQELARQGYYCGAIDGVIGPRSRAAIRAFQADRGLLVTGRIDPVLLRALGLP